MAAGEVPVPSGRAIVIILALAVVGFLVTTAAVQRHGQGEPLGHVAGVEVPHPRGLVIILVLAVVGFIATTAAVNRYG